MSDRTVYVTNQPQTVVPPVAFVERQPEPVTPSIHPDLIPESENSSAIARQARRELGAARDALERVAEFEAAVANDPTITDDARALAIYDARQKATNRATDVLAKLGQATHNAVASAEKALAEAARPKTRAHDAEIRAHVKSMSEAKRATFLQERATVGDVQAIEAILGEGIPDFLSGLDKIVSEDAARDLRERAAAVHAPQLAEALAEARRVHGRAVAAWQAGMGLIPKRDDRIEALRARATKRRTAAERLA